MRFKWNRESTIKEGILGKTIDLKPAKTEFEILFEILKDAEKYDFNGYTEIRDCVLRNLQYEINKLLNN